MQDLYKKLNLFFIFRVFLMIVYFKKHKIVNFSYVLKLAILVSISKFLLNHILFQTFLHKSHLCHVRSVKLCRFVS